MRNARSVQYPVGRCAFYGGVLVALAMLAGLVLFGAWAWRGETVPGTGLTRHGTALSGIALWSFWVALAFRSWRNSPQGLLQWDATALCAAGLLRPGVWRWRNTATGDGLALKSVMRVWDLQNRVLLRVEFADRGGQWAWLEQYGDPQRWDDLRRALVAHGQRQG